MNRTMFPEEFMEIGKALLEEYGLKGWRIVIHQSFDKFTELSTLAYTCYGDKGIHISLKGMKDYDYTFCYSTIKHELAHAILDSKTNYMIRRQKIKDHGKEWREYAYNCGVFKEELHPYSKMRSTITWKLHVLNHE